MAKKTDIKPLDSTTEEKIKAAAHVVFQKKGFAATRTRDIAEEAGVNLALLNYYFRSKEKLFNEVIAESLFRFRQNMLSVFQNETTSLDEKIELLAINYIELFDKEPELPIFLMSEVRFAEFTQNTINNQLPTSDVLKDSVFIKQFDEAVKEGEIMDINTTQFFINLLSLIVFPYVFTPFFKTSKLVDEKHLPQIMQDRKKLIPIWIKAMLKPK